MNFDEVRVFDEVGAFDVVKAPLKGCHVVEASAGTGKTYAIAGLYVRLVAERGLKPSMILVVTYTEAATQELKIRIRRRISEALAFLSGKTTENDAFYTAAFGRMDCDKIWKRLRFALENFDQSRIYTIHGFCKRAIDELALIRSSERIELSPDPTLLVNTMLLDFYRIKIYPLPDAVFEVFSKYLTFSKVASLRKFIGLSTVIRPDSGLNIHDFLRISKGLSSTWRIMRQSWLDNREIILDLLQRNAGNLKYYTAKNLKSAIADIDKTIGQSAIEVSDKIRYFDYDEMLDKRKKGFENWQPEEHEFFRLVTGYRQTLGTVNDKEFQLVLIHEFAEFFRNNLDRLKEELRIRTFDDLLRDVFKIVTRDGHGAALIGQSYEIALIDEFQDTDPMQYEIFRRIFLDHDKGLYMIGDPKQAIYAFRGADIFAYRQAVLDIREGQPQNFHTMGTNWRSSAGLISAVNTIFSRTNPFVFDWLGYNDVSHPESREDRPLTIDGSPTKPMTIWNLGDGLSSSAIDAIAASATCGEIARLLALSDLDSARLGDSPLIPKDIAVLVRSHKEGLLISNGLTSLGIPSVIASNNSIYQTDEFRDLILLLHVLRRKRPGLIRRLLITPLFGHDTANIPLVDTDDTRWDDILGRLSIYTDHLKQQGFLSLFSTIAADTRLTARLRADSSGLRRITNYRHAAELFHREEQAAGRQGLLQRMEKVSAESGNEEQELRLENDADAVSIYTLHRSKGLEWRVVFLPFLSQGIQIDSHQRNLPWNFHTVEDNETLNARYLPGTGQGDDATAQQAALSEGMSESLRLAYVGLTRATSKCYMAWGNSGKKGDKFMTWLLNPGLESIDAIAPYLNTDADIFADLQTRYSSQNIEIIDVPQNVIQPRQPQQTNFEPIIRHFSAEVKPGPIFSSFSAIARGIPDTFEDRDQEAPPVDRTPSEDPIFLFPKGANPGSMIHESFETIPFHNIMDATDNARQRVVDLLNRYAIQSSTMDNEALTDAALAMLRNTLHARIPATEMQLSDLNPSDMYSEMEFLMPTITWQRGALAGTFRRAEHMTSYAVRLNDITNSAGFVKGFIDLVFRVDGRYWILDWKTNFLGNRTADYAGDSLTRAMYDHDYILQYTLYTLALHRHLGRTLPGYDYDTHFGGAMYVFTRGVRPEQSENGVFFDRLPLRLIQELDRISSNTAGGPDGR